MKVTAGPYTGTVWNFSDYVYHQKLHGDVSATPEEQDYVFGLERTAVAYAENALGVTLLTRTLTATYFQEDGSMKYLDYPYLNSNYALPLRGGPIQSIVSLTDANGTINNPGFSTYGAGDYLLVPQIWYPPMTCVYLAGYGSGDEYGGTGSGVIPADIAHAVKAHVFFLYENRGETDAEAPKWVECFYKKRSRNLGVG